MSIFRKSKKPGAGFTLIELLVVIAIIGILASVVLASLNSARQKSRDARRIADIKQVQLALELYFDSNRFYPNVSTWAALSTAIEGGGYMTSVPNDPLESGGTPTYLYAGGATACTATTYCMVATLEDANNPVLDTDFNTPCSTTCTTGANDYNVSP